MAAAAVLAIVASLAQPAWPSMPSDETRAMEQLAARHPREAIAKARNDLAAARDRGNKRAELEALRLLAMSYENLDDNSGLREAARSGLALARELGDIAAQVELIRTSGTSAHHDGRTAEALALHDQAIALAESRGLDRELAKTYVAKAYALAYQDRALEAMDLLLKSFPIFESHADKVQMSGTLSEMGNLLTGESASREDLLRAVDYHRRAMELVDAKAHRFELSTIQHNLGTTYFYLREYAEARRWFEKCRLLARELEDPHTLAFVDYRVGLIDLAQNRADLALKRLEAALPGFRAAENIALEFLTHLGRARALAELRKRDASLEALAAAQDLMRRLESPGREAQFHEAAASVHARLGQWDLAYEQIRALRETERRSAVAAKQRLAAELQARFESRHRETENRLLRMEQKAQEARGLLMAMVLATSIAIALALVAYVVRQRRRSRRLAALAMRDDLTGIPNRRSILEYAGIQFRGRRSEDQGFVLGLLDLDHFKSINDRFGHSVGDEVLKAFAQAALHTLRGEDRLGRFGGEEFLLVMPAADSSQVPSVFARLRDAVRNIRVSGLPPDCTLTFSMGATQARRIDPDLDAVIKRADQALYRAKELGRDRHEIG